MEWVMNGTKKHYEASIASGRLDRVTQQLQDWRAGARRHLPHLLQRANLRFVHVDHHRFDDRHPALAGPHWA